MKEFIGKKVLATTQAWFIAPDGNQYRSVCGTLIGCYSAKDCLGFEVSRAHTNWFIQIGRMTIAGCQVLYVFQYDNVKEGDVEDYKLDEVSNIVNKFKRPSHIFFTE